MSTEIFSLYSDIRDRHETDASTADFIYEAEAVLGGSLKEVSREEIMQSHLPFVFIRTGGTEAEFKEIFYGHPGPFVLLSVPVNNSLPAAMEILSWLGSRGVRGEIVHGSPGFFARKIQQMEKIRKAREEIAGTRAGVIGEPSDWLIASGYDAAEVLGRTGIEIEDIPFFDLETEIDAVSGGFAEDGFYASMAEKFSAEEVLKAYRVYRGLEMIVRRYGLGAFTIRCFDLLQKKDTTACTALSRFNDAGITAGCEGDVPALLSMIILSRIAGAPVFMANPAKVNVKSNEVVFAHCTVPCGILKRYETDTHFESGKGIGIKGFFPRTAVTVFKLGADCRSCFISEGEILATPESPDLCRTQVRVHQEESVEYYLTGPLGNHHVIVPGRYGNLLGEYMKFFGGETFDVYS